VDISTIASPSLLPTLLPKLTPITPPPNPVPVSSRASMTQWIYSGWDSGGEKWGWSLK